MTDLAGRILGEFHLLERMDGGGYGVIYRAHQPRLDRPAVVKILYKRAADPEVARAHFLREAQLACRVDHPFAAHVYAFGMEPDGLLWIAMQLVDGVSLSAWLAKRGAMPLEQFVPFFERVCQVVQAAHERNILHRDIKPANIMVTEQSGELLPKLLDFGLAKLLDVVQPVAELKELPDSWDASTAGVFVGTAHYAAPEMWTTPDDVGPSSDLYALAVVAFEALTGCRPFEGESIRDVGMEHMSGKYGMPPAGLEEVFRRALARYPEDRYANALELAAAFRIEADAKLAGQIRTSAKQWIASGRSASLVWRDDMLRKMEEWTKRTSRADTGLSRASVEFIEASRAEALRQAELIRIEDRRDRRIKCGVAAGLALIVFLILWSRTELAEQRAVTAERVATATALTSEVEQGRAALLHDDLAEAAEHLGAAWARGDRSSATAFMLARARQPQTAELASYPAAKGRMWAAAWSPDGALVATGDDTSAQIWDAGTHQLLIPMPCGDTVYSVAWAGSERLITACGDGSVRIWNARTGSLVKELRLHGKAPRWRYVAAAGALVAAVDTPGALAVVWSAETGLVRAELALDGSEWPTLAVDGDRVATGGGDRVTVLDVATGVRVEIPGPGIRSIAWSAGGLLTGSTGGDVSIWSTGGVRVKHLREVGEPVDRVAVDGERIAVASRDGSVQVFAPDGRRVSQGNAIHGKITTLAVSGASVAIGGARGEVAVIEVDTGMTVASFGGRGGPVKAVQLVGSQVLAASWDGTARVWDARHPYRQWTSPEVVDGCGMVGGSQPDGSVFVVGCPGHPTRVWERDRLLAELPPLDRVVPAPYPAVAGGRVALAHGTAAELYAVTGTLILKATHAAPVTAVGVTASGELVSGDSNGVVMVAGRTISDGPPVDAIAVVGDRILIADAKGLRGVVALPVRARMLRVSPDGRRVLAVPLIVGPTIPPALVNLESRAIIARLDGSTVYGARWVQGGILTTHADGAARRWSPDGRLARTYRSNAPILVDADEDDSMVIGAGGDGTLRFWDATTGRPLWSLRAHQRMTLGVHVDSDGIRTRGMGGEISRWRIP